MDTVIHGVLHRKELTGLIEDDRLPSMDTGRACRHTGSDLKRHCANADRVIARHLQDKRIPELIDRVG
jgi:hypothetical protein